jgi:hypothetical protein
MTQFTFELVDGPNTVSGQCCLALNSQGNPQIAYAGVNANLILASRDSGTCQLLLQIDPTARVLLWRERSHQPHILRQTDQPALPRPMDHLHGRSPGCR